MCDDGFGAPDCSAPMRTAVVGRELALGAVKVGARALVRFTVNCTEQVSRCGAALQQLVAILTGLGQLGWECGHSPPARYSL